MFTTILAINTINNGWGVYFLFLHCKKKSPILGIALPDLGMKVKQGHVFSPYLFSLHILIRESLAQNRGFFYSVLEPYKTRETGPLKTQFLKVNV